MGVILTDFLLQSAPRTQSTNQQWDLFFPCHFQVKLFADHTTFFLDCVQVRQAHICFDRLSFAQLSSTKAYCVSVIVCATEHKVFGQGTILLTHLTPLGHQGGESSKTIMYSDNRTYMRSVRDAVPHRIYPLRGNYSFSCLGRLVSGGVLVIRLVLSQLDR